MKPSKWLLIILAVGILFSAILAVIKIFISDVNNQLYQLIWTVIYSVVFIVSLFDLLLSKRDLKNIFAKRSTPGSLSLGVDNKIILNIRNKLSKPVNLLVTDQYPDQVNASNIPRPLTIDSNNFAEVTYSVQPIKRGDANFGFICLSILSRFNLWQFQMKRGQSVTVKIYPNFRSISYFDTLGINNHIGQMGIHFKQRRGQGMDFHQLREYREGDSINQIDWNATARFRKPISREYQDERDQDIIFLIDCGRRMHTKHGVLSHFDHILNAFLLTSHVALKQGDAVGLMTFAGSDRWISPLKGQHNINTLLNHVYDLHSSTDTSDFSQAAQQLINKHRKRSLVIFITNIHDEDADDLKPAFEIISKQHLVIIANLRENFLDKNIQKSVNSFDSALNFAATSEYINKRHHLLETLRKRGVHIVDSLPDLLHINLINEYLSLKRRGQI
jgi:uncharacterized protein (DUF58 family)